MTPTMDLPRPIEAGRPYGPHARRAVREAIRLGLTACELGRVLEGHDPTELVPPDLHEDARAYGRRAAGELMVRYVLDGARHERRGIPLDPGKPA